MNEKDILLNITTYQQLTIYTLTLPLLTEQ